MDRTSQKYLDLQKKSSELLEIVPETEQMTYLELILETDSELKRRLVAVWQRWKIKQAQRGPVADPGYRSLTSADTLQEGDEVFVPDRGWELVQDTDYMLDFAYYRRAEKN